MLLLLLMLILQLNLLLLVAAAAVASLPCLLIRSVRLDVGASDVCTSMCMWKIWVAMTVPSFRVEVMTVCLLLHKLLAKMGPPRIMAISGNHGPKPKNHRCGFWREIHMIFGALQLTHVMQSQNMSFGTLAKQKTFRLLTQCFETIRFGKENQKLL